MAHHPSVVAYSGCNECGGEGVYTDFVMTTVAQEDQSRPIRSSCPFVGYSSGVHTLTGNPVLGAKLVNNQSPSPPPPPPLPGPDKNCVYLEGVDYHPETVLASFGTNDASACCDKCSADKDCVASVGIIYIDMCMV